MNQYIITEERLQLLYRVTKSLRVLGYSQKANMIEEVTDEVRSHPHNPQSGRDKVLDKLDKFIIAANIKCEDMSEGNYYTRSSAWDEICVIISELRPSKQEE